LIKNTDYRMVNQYIWKIFKELYGGGPDIIRREKEIYSSESVEANDYDLLKIDKENLSEMKMFLKEEIKLSDPSPTNNMILTKESFGNVSEIKGNKMLESQNEIEEETKAFTGSGKKDIEELKRVIDFKEDSRQKKTESITEFNEAESVIKEVVNSTEEEEETKEPEDIKVQIEFKEPLQLKSPKEEASESKNIKEQEDLEETKDIKDQVEIEDPVDTKESIDTQERVDIKEQVDIEKPGDVKSTEIEQEIINREKTSDNEETDNKEDVDSKEFIESKEQIEEEVVNVNESKKNKKAKEIEEDEEFKIGEIEINIDNIAIK